MLASPPARQRCAATSILVLSALGMATSAPTLARGQDASVPDEPVDAGIAVADVQRAVAATARALEDGSATPPLRFGDTMDWIRTGSGEWVRGEIDAMRTTFGPSTARSSATSRSTGGTWPRCTPREPTPWSSTTGRP